jgi:membrane associated rhomboid family serine protease
MKILKKILEFLKKVLSRIEYNSPVTLTFSLVALVAVILGALTDGRTTAALFSVYRSAASNPMTYVRLFTHVLGHADYQHFIGNIALVLVLGPIVEEKYGTIRYIAMILVTAVVAGGAHMLISSDTALMGASGIVFMLIFAAAFTGRRTEKVPLTIVLVAILYLGGELVDGVFVKDNISQISHIVGGLCGIGAGALFRTKAARGPAA